MVIALLRLNNFRNFKKREFNFNEETTVIEGENTKGKSTILEAIFYLATGYSVKAEQDREVISWGENAGRITGEFHRQFPITKEALMERLEIFFSDRKKLLVNGIGRRNLDFIGRFKAVLFRPEDLNLVTGSPGIKRRYLDFVLVQTDREYRRSIIVYEKALRQRNKLLEKIREEGISRFQLLYWDQLIIENGNYISKKRGEYLEYVNKTNNKTGNYSLYYDASVISRERLDKYSQEELNSGMTLVGPHRDNFVFNLAGKNKLETSRNISSFGSRGEQRLGLLWIKLRELDYIEQITGERPILLLDDIFSELDFNHKKMVEDLLGQQQTIITTTEKNFLSKMNKTKIINI